MRYKGYEIIEKERSEQSGKRKSRTSYMEVREFSPEGIIVKKSFRFSVYSFYAMKSAIDKAKAYVDSIVGD